MKLHLVALLGITLAVSDANPLRDSNVTDVAPSTDHDCIRDCMTTRHSDFIRRCTDTLSQAMDKRCYSTETIRVLFTCHDTCRRQGKPATREQTETVEAPVRTGKDAMPSSTLLVTPRNNFGECMAECMKKSLPDILKLIFVCHLDISCWLIHAGADAVHCLIQCIGHIDTWPSPMMQLCLATDMRTTPVEALDYLLICQNNSKCWRDHKGQTGLSSYVRCLLRSEMEKGDKNMA